MKTLCWIDLIVHAKARGEAEGEEGGEEYESSEYQSVFSKAPSAVIISLIAAYSRATECRTGTRTPRAGDGTCETKGDGRRGGVT
jgi:hypothetical protein